MITLTSIDGYTINMPEENIKDIRPCGHGSIVVLRNNNSIQVRETHIIVKSMLPKDDLRTQLCAYFQISVSDDVYTAVITRYKELDNILENLRQYFKVSNDQLCDTIINHNEALHRMQDALRMPGASLDDMATRVVQLVYSNNKIKEYVL
jgi:hypothetical protein